MPKDYARRSQKTWQNKNDKRRLPWIAILLLIIIIALLAAAIIYIKMQKNITTTPESTNTGAIVQQAKPVEIKQEETAAPEKRIQKPRPIKFDFYSMLPNMKVTVAENESTPTTTANQKERHHYLLQLATYIHFKDAVDYRDRLKELGFKPTITIIQHGLSKWFRIQIGPYNNKEAAQTIQEKLQKQNIDSVILARTE